MEGKLIFVYNANTDPVSAIVDYAHKVFKPSTYKCDLCGLTYHNFGQRSAWKKFKARSTMEMEFMYIRGFEKEFNLRFEYPVILVKNGENIQQLMGKKDFQGIESVEELIEKLEVLIDQV
jgi:hypothetical protein